MGMQGGPQSPLPMNRALQRSEEDIMEVVRRFPEIKKLELILADAGIPSET